VTENYNRFVKVEYVKLTAKQKELFNFQKIAATLADFGYNCIKLADDWQGADFLAYHINGKTTLKVQLKSRVTIDKKYSSKDIWIAFPYKAATGHGKREWYLIEHDKLVKKVGVCTKWLASPSWKNTTPNSKREFGSYSSTNINEKLLASLEENKLGEVYGPLFIDDEKATEPDALD